MNARASGNSDFIPAAYSARFTHFFAKYVRRMVRKKFYAVRILPEHASALADLNQQVGPVLVLLSHCSWWDPLLSLALHSHFTPAREPMAPMDASQLRKFGIFKRIGIFGIDPDEPKSLEKMSAYVAARFATNPLCTLWITPQGRFTDVRAPIEIRPGGAAIAAKTAGIVVLALAIEYAFWTDQKPEVFVGWRPVHVPPGRENSTPAWHRAILDSMKENNRLLSEAVISRDPAKFLPVFDSGPAPSTNWWYDRWLRLRGRSSRVEDRHFAHSRVSAGEAVPKGASSPQP
ncbi:MAG: lysophospholipid acyltransferase family protein [Phycisphaeraceae bacterium]|nr:lysophospholipid acyltransferase family protein [Phycisphaeraceae bacterium]